MATAPRRLPARQFVRKPQPEGPKRDRFLKVAPTRISNAVSMIRRLQQLGNTGTYDVTRDDARAIVTTLLKELADVEYALAHNGRLPTNVSFDPGDF